MGNWEARDKAKASAWKAYEEAMVKAEKVHEKARAAAWKALQDALAAAEKVYREGG